MSTVLLPKPAAVPDEAAAKAAAPSAPATGNPPPPVILDVRNVHTYFYTYDGVVRALDGVSFKVRRGETVGLVGETGCGKSVTAYSINRLIQEPPGRIVSGKVLFRGANLLWGIESEATFRAVSGTHRVKVRRRYRRIRLGLQRATSVRGGGIMMIFQEPSQAMNPIFSISNQMGEVLYAHHGVEILDTLLGAGAKDPALLAAEEKLGRASAAAARDPAGLTAAAQSVADAAGVPDFAPELLRRARARSFGGRSGLVRLRRLVEDARIAADVKAAVTAAREGDTARVRARAAGLARFLGLPSVEAQLYHGARSPQGQRPGGLPHLARSLTRYRLRPLQRSFALRDRRRVELNVRSRRTFFEEMRQERFLGTERRRVRAAQLANSVRRAPFRLWGVRRRADAPIQEELFWRSVQRLESVQIANPVVVARGFPHELSGGMLQRVMIAIALSTDPQLLLADEPTTALDVTIQAQILALMRELKERVGTAIVLITHDLAVIAEVADRVCVMYAGRVVESAAVRDLFVAPLHPYTQGLLASIPRLDRPEKELQSIPGSVPDLIDPPKGCRFHPRCPKAMPICAQEEPPVTVEGDRHEVACWLYHGPVAQE